MKLDSNRTCIFRQDYIGAEPYYCKLQVQCTSSSFPSAKMSSRFRNNEGTFLCYCNRAT